MSGENRQLRIFFLEDNSDDVELELYELRKAGFTVTYDIAHTRSEFLEKLPGLSADIVLADYLLPDITGIEAIRICRERNVDVPVILITGEGNELIAVDSLRLGAIDYIIKRNIAGLPARISRALEIWSDRKAKERAETEERRLHQLLFETQKMESIGRLAGGIAHDFNNLLSGIIGYSELCLNKLSPDSDLRNKLQTVITLSLRGADLVKQLLIFSKKMPMEFKIVDLNIFILGAVQFLNRMVEETVRIKLDLQENIPKVRCDTGKFTQAVMNLILNARDAMGGKGTIRIRTEECVLPGDTLPAQAEGCDHKYVSLSVIDEGEGMDEKTIQKIFEPFFTTKELGKGTGLGLAIVYSVINAHQGYIKVSSEKGAGTIFRLYLPPVRPDQEEQMPLSAEKAIERELWGVRGSETVLVAEDDDILLDLTTSVLESFGYTVIAAKDGEEALRTYLSGSRKIDIVISDMLMPKKGGIELFRDLKAANPLVRFVLVTGYSLVGEDEKTLREIDAVLSKPYMPMNLARLIRDIIDN